MNIYTKNKYKKGFTLIEILVVIGIIAILAAVVLVAVSPGKQFKQARDTQRIANVNTILNAMGQNMSDHQGLFFCNGNAITLSELYKPIQSDETSGGFNAAYCLVPEYLPKLPTDPGTGSYTDEDSYNSGYSIKMDTLGRISVKAETELQGEVVVTR